MTHDGFHTAPRGRFIAIAALVVVGLLTSACTSSSSPAASSSPVTTATPPAGTARGSMVDINTGAITPLPASIATSGVYYATRPGHSTVAYNDCCSPPNPLLMANLDGTQVHQISAPGWDGFEAQWSPDGSLLVYQQRHASANHLGNLVVQDIGTGQRTQITHFDQSKLWGWWATFPSFAPDGRSILFQLPRGHLTGENNRTWDLWSVPVTGGKQTLVRRNAMWGGYSPDGKSLAYVSPVDPQSFSGAGLWITSIHGGTPRALVRGGSLNWLEWSPDGKRIAYCDGPAIYVADAATGSATKVAEGGTAEWFDDHTLIVG